MKIFKMFFLFLILLINLVSLHELLIHLCHGYLNYITNGKITGVSPKSCKKGKKFSITDENEGTYFESLLFGSKVEVIYFQSTYCLLNGEHLNGNLYDFRKNLNFEFEPSKIIKSGFLGKLLNKYQINFNFLILEQLQLG